MKRPKHREQNSNTNGLCSAVVLLFACASCQTPAGNSVPPAAVSFERHVVDADGPADPWMKAAGDLNGDGKPDLLAGGHENGGLVWYENPGWQKHVIAGDVMKIRTDGEVADVDGDGDNDVIVLTDDGVVYYENPGWAFHFIDGRKEHDLVVADLDGDGKLDLVTRDQGAFSGQGDQLHFYWQDEPSSWTRRAFSIPDGEGVCVVDLDADGDPDAAVNGVWLENPGARTEPWLRHEYASEWDYPHTFIAAGDLNGDGRVDLVLTPAERAGQYYRISWFEAPPDPVRTPWTERVIEPEVEAVHHFVAVGDFNGDGAPDIATAEMHQGQGKEIALYLNGGRGEGWTKMEIAATGSHSMRILDVDGDGDLDLYGANWQGTVMELWINQSPGQVH